MNQKYTSANTSINSKRLPAIYKMVADRINETETVIDYGCGKYFDSYELGDNFFGYDPFNRAEENLLNATYDVALCSNVLNVIMESEIRRSLLETLKRLAKKIYITVYEGNGSGIGKESKGDCYQLNKKRGDYIPELVAVFGEENVSYNKRGYFECKGNIKY